MVEDSIQFILFVGRRDLLGSGSNPTGISSCSDGMRASKTGFGSGSRVLGWPCLLGLVTWRGRGPWGAVALVRRGLGRSVEAHD